MPAESSTTISPSNSAELTPSVFTAAAMLGNRAVQSRPLRVRRRTSSPSIRACVRYPSYLISCTHFGPLGGLPVVCARLGSRNVGRMPLRAPRTRPGSGSATLRFATTLARPAWSLRKSPSAANCSVVRPLRADVVSSSVMSPSPARLANSSSALISSHGSVFSPRLPRMRTRCQRPLSRAPSSVNSR